VLAYDTVYAMVDRDDDLKVGMKTSATTLGRFDVAAVAAFHALHLLSWALLGRWLGLGGWFLVGVGAAAMQAAGYLWLVRRRTERVAGGLSGQPLARLHALCGHGGGPRALR
jgi:4-hydroxybenzoate polyprenyltransferase